MKLTDEILNKTTEESPSFLSTVQNRVGKSFQKDHQIAVIGGGRWGKILTKVLTSFESGISDIHFVSSRSHSANKTWLEANSELKEKVNLINNIESVLNNQEIDLAVVANHPKLHYITAKKLLLANKHVLVEKPFVQTDKEAKELIALAKERNLVLAVGLEFFMAGNVQRFKSVLEQNNFRAKDVSIIWNDRFSEMRHGEKKTADMTVNVYQDIAPHAFSMLQVLFGQKEIEIKDVDLHAGGNCVNVATRYGDLPVKINLDRDAMFPFRKIQINGEEGKTAVLNFTKEPSKIILNGTEVEADVHWDQLPGSLNIELDQFIHEVEERNGELQLLAENNHQIVTACEKGGEKIRRIQLDQIRRKMLEDYPTKPNNEVLFGLREHILHGLLEEGLVKNFKDVNEIHNWVTTSFRIIHRFSISPFDTQRQVVEEMGIDKETLISINKVLRGSTFAQELMTHGHGEKYWNNSIIPLIKSGVIKSSLENKYEYPHRVGVYLGPSCMYNCSFCGRNPEAKYEPSSVKPGNELLKKMFDKAPKNDPYRFYISGGLEPLTNTGLGEVITHGTNLGFKLSCYTNGFMLTPNLLKRQPGIWDLDTLRISLYGVDEETTTAVNKKKNSFGQVVNNAINFLRLREEEGRDVKFGFNFVILPGCVDQVLKLAELIAHINKEAGTKRQVDFLTLREDYSVDTGLLVEERKKLTETFKKLDARKQEDDLKGLYIDYGYALHSPRIGMPGKPLERIKWQEMRPQGYPQVSMVVDLLGDVYLYREAGFLDREGSKNYILDRINNEKGLADITREFIESGKKIEPQDDDTRFFDAFDHSVTKLILQAEDDEAYGIPFEHGPLTGRNLDNGGEEVLAVAHPSLPDTVQNTSK